MKKPRIFQRATQNELSRRSQGALYGDDKVSVIHKKKRGPNFHPKRKKKGGKK